MQSQYPIPLDLSDNIETIPTKIVPFNLTVVSVSCPAENLATLDMIIGFNGSFISGGDLNGKHPNWNNFHSNHNGKILDKHALKGIYSIIDPLSHIHFKQGYFSIIVNFFLTNSFTDLQYEVSESLFSDNKSVLLIRSNKLKVIASVPSTDSISNRKETHKLGIISKLSSIREINSAIANLHRFFRKCLFKITKYAPNRFIFPNPELKELNLRNAIRHRYRNSYIS